MKQLETIMQSPNDVFAIGNIAPDGMCNQYWIERKGVWKLVDENRLDCVRPNDKRGAGDIYFQNDYAADIGVTEADLLEIVRDRLKDYQNGPYACHTNVVALTHVSAALHNLKARTQDRAECDVSGAGQE